MSNVTSLNSRGDGECRLAGELVFSSVTALLPQITPFFKAGSSLVIDLSEVGSSDSAGVALLVEWLRQARNRQVDLSFRNIPSHMWAIVEVSDLDKHLPVVHQ